jgi:hypothetical protein
MTTTVRSRSTLLSCTEVAPVNDQSTHVLGDRSPAAAEGRQAGNCPPRARDAVMRYLTVRRYPQISATEPAFWGSYRSDDLCATAAWEPRPYRALRDPSGTRSGAESRRTRILGCVVSTVGIRGVRRARSRP